MTMRLGPGPQAMLRYARTKQLCECFTIVRVDGVQLRFCTHDAPVYLPTIDETFSPTPRVGATSERRQSALRGDSLQLFGAISSGQITTDDLRKGLYRNASLLLRVVDWQFPWNIYRESQKWIDRVSYDGIVWTADVTGHVRFLQQTTSGPQGATFSKTCQYKLGDPNTCGKDISAWHITPSTVDAVIDPFNQFRTLAAHWGHAAINSFDNTDGEYAMGNIVWATGSNAGLKSVIYQWIASDPNATTSRLITLLHPVPFAMQVGDSFSADVGCDGLIGTCKNKFNNVNPAPPALGFGGSAYDPIASDAVEGPQ